MGWCDGSTSGRIPKSKLQLAWEGFLGHLRWQHFVTLTFDPKRVYPVGNLRAANEVRKWCGLVGWTCRKPVGWLSTLERHRSGQWHAHALLIGVQGDLEPLVTLWERRNGEISVKPITDGGGAILYTTKQAALEGEIEISDTLSRYKGSRMSLSGVQLYERE